MLMSPEQEALITRVFEAYVTEHHHDDVMQLMADTYEETHCPVVVNAMTLFEANMEVGDYFNAYPDDVLAIFDKVLLRKFLDLSKDFPMHQGGQRMKEKKMRLIPHARITGLPVCPELTRDTIPRSRDVGHFLSVTGTVIRTSVTKVLEYERDYMCTKCRHVFTVQADFEQHYTFVQVVACPNPDGCNSFKFTCLSGGSEPAACRDYQEIKIQEQVQRLSVGSIPRSVVVVLEDDLVDCCKSGDDVTVYGVVCLRWKPFSEGSCCDVDVVLKANNIEVNNQQATAALVLKDVQREFDDFWLSFKHDPMAGRNQILLSLCPQVFGMYLIKLAVAMVLAGGVQRIDSSGTKIRGECHMLLVGDPGTGKSQFLKYAAKVIPRSVLTAGIGSTSAGLTVAAVKDGGDWHLEAGALVLSDGGLCCIDEFNSIKEHDRISIHEAMEQQSISVAKAGIVCKLNTRTTILAATNPKGQYDPNESLSVNVALASPLLSRFDLVLVLMDTRNAEWDRIISSFILEDRDNGGICSESSSLWPMEKMKAYFSVIKRLQPQVSDEANRILARYYQLQRQSDGRNSARTTIRMLESLGRLAEAHARLMYRETVTIEDAVMAVSVMECSMQGGALLGSVNALLTSFPDDPGQQYESQCQILLTGLNLPVLLQKELDRLARIKSNAPEASPPPDHSPHQFNHTHSITRRDDTTNNSKDDDLDWFHSIGASLVPGEMTSPTITSTQENLRKPRSSWLETSAAKQPNRQKENDSLNTSGSFLTCDVVTNLFETTRAQSESNKGESYVIPEMRKLSDERKNGNQADSPECVLQKVSKNLRDRRLNKLELNHRLGDVEGRERVLSRAATSDNVTDMTSEPHTSNSLSSGKQDDRRQKILDGAETSKDMQAKLSGFVFKPKKMKPLVPDLSVSSRDFHSSTEKGTSKQRLSCHSDSITDQGKRKKHNQTDSAGCVSEPGGGGAEANICLTTQEPHKENQSRLQRAQISTGDSFRPSSRIADPAPAKSDQTKFTVASTTLAKLSRFSFCSTPELSTTAQAQVGKPLLGGNKDSPLMENHPVSKCKENQAEAATATTSPSVKTANVGPADFQSSVNTKKRKCFELNPAPPGGGASRGFYSGLPLFGSTDLNNDVLDTDWDQEVSKKAKG